jgi:hypothetical protein
MKGGNSGTDGTGTIVFAQRMGSVPSGSYDASGNMVEKNVAGVYTEILYSPVGKTG